MINNYEREKAIYYALDFNKLTELRKAQLLKNLIDLDSSIRSHKTNNKSWLLDLYISDEIEQVKLVEGWEK